MEKRIVNLLKKDRNSLIEILRFLAVVSIACYHYEWIYVSHPVFLVHNYIWVEFFYVIAGYFLAKNYYKKDTYSYVWSQVKKLYPIYLISFSICFIMDNVNNTELSTWIINLWHAKYEVLLMSNWGFDNNAIVYNMGGPAAYISVLVVSTLAVHYLLSKHKDFFVYLFAPIFVIVIYSRFVNVYGNFSQWINYDGITNVGIYRGIADMCVGVIFSVAFEKMISRINIIKKILITVVCLSSILGMVLLRDYIVSTDLVIYPFIFALLISILDTMRVSGIFKFIGSFFSELSTPIFIFHYPVIKVMKIYLPDLNYYKGILFFLMALIIISFFYVKLSYVVTCKLEQHKIE